MNSSKLGAAITIVIGLRGLAPNHASAAALVFDDTNSNITRG